MPRPPKADRNSVRATRPTGARPASLSMPGVGATYAFGPSPSDVGQPQIQKSEGDNGSAIVAIMFTTPLMPFVRDADLKGMRALMTKTENLAVSLSKGPYSLKMLAAMEHPYAVRHREAKRTPKLRAVGHSVPRFQPGRAIGHVKGISGSVTTLSVANIQSGHFADSWSSEVAMTAGGVTGFLRNSAEYAFYLLEGTEKMIAHGPFEYVARLMMPQFMAEWSRVVAVAWGRQPKVKAERALRNG